MWKIPLFDCELGADEIDAVQIPIRSGWLTMGPITEQLEQEFCRLTGARHAIAVTNCTAALHLALAASGVQPGDEVIVPSLTFVATANAARYCGAEVVFAEVVGERDLTLSPDDVYRKISTRTKAVVAMHYAGFPADVERLREICEQRDLVLVEDSAHALFSSIDGKTLGTFGVSGCFSFFSNKNMTCGEGGMLITDDAALAKRIGQLRSHGMTSLTLDRHKGHAWSYDCLETGWNYRIDEIRASLALAQLKKLPENLRLRRRLRNWYLEELSDLPVSVPFTSEEDLARSESIGPHIMPILLPTGVSREEVMAALKSKGIQTSIHYPPVHSFTSFQDQVRPLLPRTEDLARRELTLPFFPQMTLQNVQEVCRELRAAVTHQAVGEFP